MIDLHRGRPVVGLTDRELDVVRDALWRRKVDLLSLVNLCIKTDTEDGRGKYAAQLVEVDVVLLKLGNGSQNPTGDEEAGKP